MLAPACHLHLHRTYWSHSGVWFLPADQQGSLCVLLLLCKHHLAVSDSSLGLDSSLGAPSGPHSAPVPWLISLVLFFYRNFVLSLPLENGAASYLSFHLLCFIHSRSFTKRHWTEQNSKGDTLRVLGGGGRQLLNVDE